MTSPTNPHNLCTWQPAEQCTGCAARDALNCRLDTGDLLYFMVIFLPPAITAVGGMLRAGFAWWLLGWLGYALFFFFVWEARVLCSHCPFWAEEGRVLHCLANYGVIKLWRYRPEPMSRAEQVQFLVGAGLLLGFPLPFLLLGGEFLLTAVSLAGFVAFGVSLRRHVCTRCVNFSCPLNAVPPAVVAAYLRRNPVMRAAWEPSGYELDAHSDCH